MTIKVSKPAINLREKLNELEQDTGLKGQELMRADTVAEARTAIGAGRKNLIINGDFKVSQRGDYTSATSAVHTTFYLDRWCPNIGTVTGTIQDTGFAVKLVATSTASGSLRLRQKFEEMSYLSGKTVTISCQMKSNDANSRIGVYADGWQSTTATHTGGGEWETISITLTLPSGVSSEPSVHFGIDGANSVDVSITSGAYCEIKEAQMELGSVATDFEHRSYGEELALCQRYFETSYPQGTALGGSSSYSGDIEVRAGTVDVSSVSGSFRFSVEKRTTPTLTIYSPDSGATGTMNRYSSGTAVTVTGVEHIGSTGFARVKGSVVANAPYRFHWTADAEL